MDSFEIGFPQEDLLAEVKQAEKEILNFWLENQRRHAQSRLVALHQTLEPTFEHLRTTHHMEALAGEHQIGWVLHRLRYAPSKSQKREQAYLKNMSEHLQNCISLLPPEPLVEEVFDDTAADSMVPLISDSKTSNTVLLHAAQ